MNSTLLRMGSQKRIVKVALEPDNGCCSRRVVPKNWGGSERKENRKVRTDAGTPIRHSDYPSPLFEFSVSSVFSVANCSFSVYANSLATFRYVTTIDRSRKSAMPNVLNT